MNTKTTHIGIALVTIALCLVGVAFFGQQLQQETSQQAVRQTTAQVFVPTAQTITVDQAKSIAQQAFTDATYKEIESETYKGLPAYSVEMVSETEEIEVIISTEDGQILAIDREDLVLEEELSAANPEITEEEARALALQMVPGRITEVELDRDGGIVVYEVSLEWKGDEYEVVIDISSGEVIEIERESEDDDDDDDEEDDDDD